jgi:hypothetical protein
MTVPTDAETASQVQRLIELGYSVVEVLPPLEINPNHEPAEPSPGVTPRIAPAIAPL